MGGREAADPEACAALAELRRTVAQPFGVARAMPKSVYSSDEFLALEQSRLFAREWICAGRADALAKPGDYLTMELAGEPIVVLRDSDGALRALSNVCRHRMSVLLKGRGNIRTITCPYHAWSYRLDGGLRAAPAMGRNRAFCADEIALPQIACTEWQGWILVNLDGQAPSPEKRLSGLAPLVGDYGMAHYVESFREDFRWATNWKVLAENFMESYHLPVCHAETIGGTVDLAKMDCPEGAPAFNYHSILKNGSLDLALAHPSNTRLRGDQRRTTWLLTIYPALLITLSPGYFWYLSLTPDGPGHVRVLYGGGMAPEFASDPHAQQHFDRLRALLDAVNAEDKECVERVYRGLCARLSAPGPMSHLERPNYDFARYIAERLSN